MKSLLFLSAFAASVNGLVGRVEPACCFYLNVTGEVTGPLGQLVDGQSRVGDYSLPQSQFCINSTGVVTDATGKGCIITTETTQFQCDEGKPGTPGFSISASGQLQFHGSTLFIACETGQNGGMNIYTTNSTSVTRCKAVILNADTCLSTGNIPVVPIPPAPGGSVSLSVSTFISTVTVSNCVCSTTAAPGAPGGPAPAPAPAPASSAPGPAAPPVSSQTSSAPATTAPAPVPVAPAPHTSASSGTTATPTSTGSAAPPSGTTHTSAAPVAPVPVQPTTAPGETQPSSAASSTNTSSVCPSHASASSSSAQSSATSPCPSCSQSATSSAQSSATTPCPVCQSASISSAHPSSPCPSCTSASATAFTNSTRISSIPVTTSPSSVRPSSTIHVNSTSTAVTSTSASATSCPTNLSGSFEFPHLMVRIDSTKPDTTHSTGLNGTINSTVSTTFNFDIPSSLSGRTCSLVFLFPKKEDLVTTSFSFTGDGKIAVGKLSQTVSSSTTFNNVPSVSQGLGVITISPGNSFVISTFSCPAGQAVAFEMKNAGSTDLEFFEDFNPPPLGLFITSC